MCSICNAKPTIYVFPFDAPNDFFFLFHVLQALANGFLNYSKQQKPLSLPNDMTDLSNLLSHLVVCIVYDKVTSNRKEWRQKNHNYAINLYGIRRFSGHC